MNDKTQNVCFLTILVAALLKKKTKNKIKFKYIFIYNI